MENTENNEIQYNIRELDVDIIRPSSETMNDTSKGGSKIVIIGKPGTGKTTVITSLLYEKHDIFPVGMVMSGSEDSNHHFAKFFPDLFIYDTYNEEKINNFIQRQKISKEYISNPWAVLLLDDCTDSKTIFNKPTQQGLFKRGRHWNMLYILSMQYALDMPSTIRSSVDGVFIMREPNDEIRRKIWKNYAGIIPEYSTFCEFMNQITNDYTALYIHNMTQSNNLEDCVFWYKACENIPEDFKFGCKEYWEHHNKRYNTDYVKTLF
jgi:GTPase SAR1 family protein